MKVIYKYPLKIVEEQTIELPRNSQILKVDTQKGALQLWTKVDPDEKRSADVKIVIYGTGRAFQDNDNLFYLSTVRMHQDMLVWHVFWDQTTYVPITHSLT